MPNRRLVLQTIAARNCHFLLSRRLRSDTSTLVIFIALLSSVALIAQETPKPPDQTGQQPAKPPSQNETLAAQVTDAAKKPVQLFNLLERKSIVFPDIAANTTALSTVQKFQLFVDNSVSVHTIMASALGSAIGQADNSPTGFGQGWDAYGKRFGTSLARGASAEFFGTFVLASALHEDPRFFPEVNPGFVHGVKYSVKRLFVARNDAGRDTVNISGPGRAADGRRTRKCVLARSQPDGGRYAAAIRYRAGHAGGRKYDPRILAGAAQEDEPLRHSQRSTLALEEKERPETSSSAHLI